MHTLYANIMSFMRDISIQCFVLFFKSIEGPRTSPGILRITGLQMKLQKQHTFDPHILVTEIRQSSVPA